MEPRFNEGPRDCKNLFSITRFCLSRFFSIYNYFPQRAKKVVSDSPGLVDFAIGLGNSVFNLPDGQVIFF